MKMKKTLAILLTLALVICMIPGSAFAETYDGVSFEFKAGYETEFVYNGKAQVPTLTIDRTEGETTTTLEADKYDLKYFDGTTPVEAANVIAAKTYTVEAWSKSNNKLCSAQFTIKPLDLTKATISLSTTATAANALNPVVMLNGTAVDSKYFTIKTEQQGTGSNVYLVTATPTAEVDGTNVIGTTIFASATLKTDLTGAKFSAIANQAYTGSAIEPSFTVTVDNKYLTKNTDYTVVYTNNVNGGQRATVTITGIGNYTGQASTYFDILQKDITSYGITATVAEAVSGKGDPAVVVKDGDKVLVNGTDYVLSYTNGTGTGNVTITGINSYKGTKVLSYNIVAADKNLADAVVYVGYTTGAYSADYNGSAQTPVVAVYLNNVQLSSNYYTVTYSDNIKPGTATITINGKNGYGGTKTASFTIKATQMNQYNTVISGVSSSYTYTGLAITPTVSVSVNGKTLTYGKDYTVSYSNNKNISTQYSKAKVYIYPALDSGYTGSAYAEFTIAGKSMYGCTASFANGISYSEYNGVAVKPTIVVKDGYYTALREYTDYTVTIKDASGKVVSAMKDAGTYTIVITGKGNYSGEMTLTYTIKGVDISYYNVTLNKTSAKATGAAQSVSVTSVKYGTKALGSSNYTVSYQNSLGQTVTSMKEPGTYKVVVTGKGGYSGSTYATFVITGEPQTVTLNKGNVKIYKDTDPFKVTAKATGDGTGFIWTSSNPEVATVNAYGVVTVKTIGRAKITATTVGMKKSEEASASFVVKVYPDKATISKKPWTEGKKGSLRVRWDIQEDATYYEVRYSRDKSFKKGTYKTKKVTASEKYDTQSTALKDLYSGKTYYVKVRAVKVVYNDFGEELKYYGTWSGWRSAKTK